MTGMSTHTFYNEPNSDALTNGIKMIYHSHNKAADMAQIEGFLRAGGRAHQGHGGDTEHQGAIVHWFPPSFRFGQLLNRPVVVLRTAYSAACLASAAPDCARTAIAA